MRRFKIKKIEYGPDIDRTRIYGFSHYRRLRKKYDPEKKYTPTWDELKKYGPIDELWFLKSITWFTVHFKRGGWIQAKFKPCMIWDGASDPIFKEWILEVWAAMFHDACGSLHLLFPHDNNKGFRAANSIFFEILYYSIANNDFDYSWFKRMRLRRRARIHYAFVSGIYARSLYQHGSTLRAPNHSKTVQFACSRINEFQ